MIEHRGTPLRAELWEALRSLPWVPVESKAEPLFRYGQSPRGVYLVETGEVRLWLTAKSTPGRCFGVAGPGSVLGLSETVTGGDYKLTAKAGEGACISYIDRNVFLHCMRRDHQLCMHIVRLLSEDLHSLYCHSRALIPGGSRQDATASRREN